MLMGLMDRNACAHLVCGEHQFIITVKDDFGLHMNEQQVRKFALILTYPMLVLVCNEDHLTVRLQRTI